MKSTTVPRARALHRLLMAAAAMAATACTQNGNVERAEDRTPPAPPPPAVSDTGCWDGVDAIPANTGCFSVTVDLAAGEPQVYEVLMTFPDNLRFDGFTSVGPPGSPIGSLGLDFDLDDVAENFVPIYSRSNTTGYADLTANGIFEFNREPHFEYVRTSTFRLLIPADPAADPETLIVPFDARATLRLRDVFVDSGLQIEPEQVVTGQLITVDPDTNGYDDRTGTDPVVVPFTARITRFD